MEKRNPRTKKGWRKYCSDLWAYAVKLRDRCTCQYCGKQYEINSRGLHAHHIKTKGSSPSLRYDMDNGISLCFYCHRNIAHGTDIENPGLFKKWIIEKFGQEWFDNLIYMSHQYKKHDLQLTAKILEEVIEEMGGF